MTAISIGSSDGLVLNHVETDRLAEGFEVTLTLKLRVGL